MLNVKECVILLLCAVTCLALTNVSFVHSLCCLLLCGAACSALVEGRVGCILRVYEFFTLC